jgi:hypothetical protein
MNEIEAGDKSPVSWRPCFLSVPKKELPVLGIPLERNYSKEVGPVDVEVELT